MVFDLFRFEEALCERCRKPFTFRAMPNKQARFEGCNCKDRVMYEPPNNCIIAGFGDLMFLYKPRTGTAEWAEDV
jgi:hypothetical protein